MTVDHIVAALAACLGAWLELRRGDTRERVAVLEARVGILERRDERRGPS